MIWNPVKGSRLHWQSNHFEPLMLEVRVKKNKKIMWQATQNGEKLTCQQAESVVDAIHAAKAYALSLNEKQQPITEIIAQDYIETEETLSIPV